MSHAFHLIFIWFNSTLYINLTIRMHSSYPPFANASHFNYLKHQAPILCLNTFSLDLIYQYQTGWSGNSSNGSFIECTNSSNFQNCKQNFSRPTKSKVIQEIRWLPKVGFASTTFVRSHLQGGFHLPLKHSNPSLTTHLSGANLASHAPP
jgi:hypothetical protein